MTSLEWIILCVIVLALVDVEIRVWNNANRIEKVMHFLDKKIDNLKKQIVDYLEEHVEKKD